MFNMHILLAVCALALDILVYFMCLGKLNLCKIWEFSQDQSKCNIILPIVSV